MSETDLNAAIRLAIGGRDDVRLSRNNSGGTFNPAGQFVRFGLFSPGGADLIGIRRRVIVAEDVGSVFGQFIAFESKARRGKASEQQKLFLAMVREFGGVAGVVRSVADAEELLR